MEILGDSKQSPAWENQAVQLGDAIPTRRLQSSGDYPCQKNARYDTPFFRSVAERRGLQGEQLEKALARYKSFQETDIKIADDQRALFDWSGKQTYIALANMLTGAAAIGIDSCPIEGFNYDKMNEVLAAEGLFDTNEWGVSVAATFGYRAKEITKKSRKPIDEMVTWVE